MKISVYLLVTFFTLSLKATPDSKLNYKFQEQLVVSTYNLKWFGQSGSMWNELGSEFRAPYLKRFVDQELKNSDVIIFVEVTDPKLLSDTLSHRFECITYESKSPRHQRVVNCFNPNKYRIEKYDEDYIIPEVALESMGLRPATQVKICHISGPCFLQLIGVHLIAGDKTPLRIQQMEILNKELEKQAHPLPTVIAGDFNSYVTEQSGLEEDDVKSFEKILTSSQRVFKTLNTGIKTYGAPEWGKAYDHIIVSNEIVGSQIHGYKACEKSIGLNEKFIPYYSYSRYFSDHCPLTAELLINTKSSKEL
jgi:hypothetical protein